MRTAAFRATPVTVPLEAPLRHANGCAVLVQPDGTLTERARTILARTPMGRFGDPADLQGPVLWLCSDAASFVTGAVIPVDGGFSADSGI